MLDAACRRIEPVEAVPSANVKTAVDVFSDHFGVVTRQALRCRVADKGGSLRSGVVDAYESTSCGREPEPARAIRMDVHDRAWRQSLARSERLETALRVAGQPTIETNPDVPGGVFSKRTRQVLLERWHPGRVGQIAKCSAGAVPTGQAIGVPCLDG